MNPSSSNPDNVKRVRKMTLPVTLFCCVLALVAARSEVLANDTANHPPAGTQLAFVRDGQIFLVNSDGNGLARLTHTGSSVANRDPAWSPDGQRLAFARGGSDGWPEPWDIYIMDADGSNVIQLTSGGYNLEPAWAPDGRTIVFTSWTFTKGAGLSMIDVDAKGSQENRVLFDLPGQDDQPAWSPDGRTLTFTSDHRAYDTLYDLYAVNADGSDVRPILEGPFFAADGLRYYNQSAWSPNAQSIAVVINYTAIAVANPDGSGLRVLAQGGGPTWSPDGQWIAYGSSCCSNSQSSVRFVHVDGGTEGLIVENGNSPAWRPGPGARIDVSHSGAWFNPDTSGQGFFIDAEPETQFLFLSWFTYTDSNSENPEDQHWFTAQGTYDGTEAGLILYETLGGRFDDSQPVSTNPVGTATLRFSDCGHGLLSYRVESSDLDGMIPLQRAIPGGESICENLTGASNMPLDPNDGWSGAWYDENTPGQGFVIDTHSSPDGDDLIFIAWFTYGDGTASGQRWLTAQGPFAGTTAEIVVYETTGGSFDDSRATNTIPVGTLSVNFKDCSNARLTYSLTDEGLENSIDLTRAIPGTQVLCLELAGQNQ